MSLQRLGHAALLVETGAQRILIDPGVYSSVWHGLTKLDAVVVTHEHHDHFDRDHTIGLARRNPGARVLAPRSVSDSLAGEGVEAMPIEPGDGVVLGEVDLEFGGGLHALVHSDIPRVANVGVVLRSPGGLRLFHPGDDYSWAPPSIDVLALPLMGPWSSVERTVDFVRSVDPGVAFPIHDAGLSQTGVATFMRILGQLVPEGSELRAVGPTEELSA